MSFYRAIDIEQGEKGNLGNYHYAEEHIHYERKPRLFGSLEPQGQMVEVTAALSFQVINSGKYLEVECGSDGEFVVPSSSLPTCRAPGYCDGPVPTPPASSHFQAGRTTDGTDSCPIPFHFSHSIF